MIERDVRLLSKLGWTKFIAFRRGRGDFNHLRSINHPARRLLSRYRERGAPVRFSTPPWSPDKLSAAIQRGPHRSCNEHIDFLEEEFIDMIRKGQWVILPASIAATLPDLRASPPGVIPQRDRRPRWIGDYSWSDVNEDTLPDAPLDAMQFGHAFDRILREILLANPSFGPVWLNKTDLSDGFYRVNLSTPDIPKLALIFPTRPGQEPLLALPLVLPMGWKNSPPIFCAATETIADVTNDRLRSSYQPPQHPLDTLAASITSPPADHHDLASPPLPLPVPSTRDPSLPSVPDPLQYIDVFVDDFISAAQRPFLRRVRNTLLHVIDEVFRPVDSCDPPARREPVSLKKLRAGDCSWGTSKLVLGWVVDTIAMTIALPAHRRLRLWELLDGIPLSQKRTSVKKWYKLLGELRSMSIALPGSRSMFGRLQKALSDRDGHRINLSRGVHQALEDFRWMAQDISTRPTRIAELVPLASSAEGHHDASGAGAGGIWFPGQDLTPRTGFSARVPVVWRLRWPDYITARLITDDNPSGTITNSDLELAGGLLHLDCLAQTFDIRERTCVSKGDNLNTTFWERKGSTTTNSAPAFLLRLFGIHQRFHRYVPRFDYLPGSSNHVADALSRDFDTPLASLTRSLSPLFSQTAGCQVWTPPNRLVSAIISALLRKQSPKEFLLAAPAPPSPHGSSGSTSPLTWASTPFSKPSKTKYQSFKSSSTEFVAASLQPAAVQFGLDRLKITYGQLPRRSSPWGPKTPASTRPTKLTFESNACSPRGKSKTPLLRA